MNKLKEILKRNNIDSPGLEAELISHFQAEQARILTEAKEYTIEELYQIACQSRTDHDLPFDDDVVREVNTVIVDLMDEFLEQNSG